MNRFTKFDIIDYLLTAESYPKPHSALLNPTSDFDFALDILNPSFPSLDFISPFDDFRTITDLIQIDRTTPFGATSARKLITRQSRSPTVESLYLQSLSDRVSALELGFDLVNEEKVRASDRKYTWTAEINSSEKNGLDRKYKLTTEIKGGKKKEKTSKWTAEINSTEKNGLDRKYKLTTEIKGGKKKEKTSKWTAEIKRKGDNDVRKYTFTASTANAAIDDNDESEKKNKEKNKQKDKKKEKSPRIVEIQSSPDHGSILLKQAFARALERNKGKKKELSPQDAAMMIQRTFRAYLIKRSQSLRALRELAVAKGKLKELRTLFNNLSYRRRITRDAEEKQRFSEKVIVLLLTVDAIEGADIMVRAAKRSMVDELEAMLDVVDPQPGGGRSLSLKRRTFDMPDSVIQKELAEGVSQVVRMLGEEDHYDSETYEAHL